LKKPKSEISCRTFTCREAGNPQMLTAFLYQINSILVKKKIREIMRGPHKSEKEVKEILVSPS
jgi:hypothetical protein